MSINYRKIALIPDRFAHYRYPLFKLLSAEDNDFELTIFADTKETNHKIKIVDKSFCDLNLDNGGVRWIKTSDFYFLNIKIWQSKLIELAFSKEYDVIIYWGNAYEIAIWISVIIAKLNNKKVVFWSHGLYGNESKLKYWLRIKFYSLANAILLYGNHAYQLLEKVLNNNISLYIINNSLDLEKQNSIFSALNREHLINRKKELFNQEDKVISFIGRLETRKKLNLLINAIHELNKKDKYSIKLLLIGDGSEKENLKTLVKEMKLENRVTFFGACYDDSVTIPLLAISDIVVSPGEVGLTAMHSLISGTPVITHDDLSNQMPEVEAIREGINGFFFEKDNLQDLVKKIICCFEYIDLGKINASTCREVILKEYTPSFQLKVFEKMLDNLREKLE